MVSPMIQAAVNHAKATVEAHAGLRPLARESARRAAQVAEDEFIAARLLYWQGVFNINPAGKAKE